MTYLFKSFSAAWMAPSPKIHVSALQSLQTKYDTFDKGDPLRAKWLRCRKQEHRVRMKDAEEMANFLAEDMERKREEKDRVRGKRIEERVFFFRFPYS
jgi:pyrroloquinoline quinone (PQQ) biosynthesis protein C